MLWNMFGRKNPSSKSSLWGRVLKGVIVSIVAGIILDALIFGDIWTVKGFISLPQQTVSAFSGLQYQLRRWIGQSSGHYTLASFESSRLCQELSCKHNDGYSVGEGKARHHYSTVYGIELDPNSHIVLADNFELDATTQGHDYPQGEDVAREQSISDPVVAILMQFRHRNGLNLVDDGIVMELIKAIDPQADAKVIEKYVQAHLETNEPQFPEGVTGITSDRVRVKAGSAPDLHRTSSPAIKIEVIQ